MTTSLKPEVRDLVELANRARQGATRHARRSIDHGENHWRDVAHFAVKFARASGGDPLLAFAFGAIHDTQRLNDYHDPDHGFRAAVTTIRICEPWMWWFDDEQFNLLDTALRLHNEPRTSADPTIGSCWDGDRVTLWRVGKTPDPAYLSTQTARLHPYQANNRFLNRGMVSWKTLAEQALDTRS